MFVGGLSASGGSYDVSAMENEVDDDYEYLFKVTLQKPSYTGCRVAIAHSTKVERDSANDPTPSEFEVIY